MEAATAIEEMEVEELSRTELAGWRNGGRRARLSCFEAFLPSSLGCVRELEKGAPHPDDRASHGLCEGLSDGDGIIYVKPPHSSCHDPFGSHIP